MDLVAELWNTWSKLAELKEVEIFTITVGDFNSVHL